MLLIYFLCFCIKRHFVRKSLSTVVHRERYILLLLSNYSFIGRDLDLISPREWQTIRPAGAVVLALDCWPRLRPCFNVSIYHPCSCWQSHEVQHPQRRRQRLKQQPLPREVDYTFRSADLGRKPLTPVAGPESAPLGQNTMGVAQRAALDQRQGLQASSRAATKLWVV